MRTTVTTERPIASDWTSLTPPSTDESDGEEEKQHHQRGNDQQKQNDHLISPSQSTATPRAEIGSLSDQRCESHRFHAVVQGGSIGPSRDVQHQQGSVDGCEPRVLGALDESEG